MQSLLPVLLRRFWRKYFFSFGYIGFSVFDVNGISLLRLDGDYFLFIFFFICVSWFLVLSFVRSRRFWVLCSLNLQICVLYISLWLFCLFSPSGNLAGCIGIRLFAEHLFFIFHIFHFLVSLPEFMVLSDTELRWVRHIFQFICFLVRCVSSAL